nr:hypothetical protein [Nonomuraea fuscirosea]
MTEEDAAERPDHEPHAERGEGDDGAGGRVGLSEEQAVEDEGGGGAVDEEVVPLQGGTDEGAQDDAP